MSSPESPQKKRWCVVHDQPALLRQSRPPEHCRYWWASGECDMRVAWLYIDVSPELVDADKEPA